MENEEIDKKESQINLSGKSIVGILMWILALLVAFWGSALENGTYVFLATPPITIFLIIVGAVFYLRDNKRMPSEAEVRAFSLAALVSWGATVLPLAYYYLSMVPRFESTNSSGNSLRLGLAFIMMLAQTVIFATYAIALTTVWAKLRARRLSDSAPEPDQDATEQIQKQ